MKKENGKKIIFGMEKNNFKENDIRPVELLTDQIKAVQLDIDFLLKRKADFVTVNCPSCNSSISTNKYQKSDFNYVECSECSTIYMNPRASASLLGEFYGQSANYQYWNDFIFPASEQVRRQRIFVPRVDKVLDFCKKYSSGFDSILEVGAGFGTFCEEMQSRLIFNRIVAIEPTPGLAETCRSKNIETIEKPIEEINLSESEKFDVVVNFEVIEHLFSPKDFIEKCTSLLKKDGLFVVTCPNGKGFDIQTLGTVSKTVDHEHVNYFNPDSLATLLENCGFEILESITPGVLDAELVRNAVLEDNFSLENNDFLPTKVGKKLQSKDETLNTIITKNKVKSVDYVFYV
jgi:2-polyprenyl-3-methyl-5-hydroxy-6-metoxy-1,4-benzoquinol methylase/ribosomal protein S27E